jgi:hypothetical protein
VLVDGKLEQLNPDLSPTGTEFEPDRGRAVQMSPDGKVIGWELNPGTALIDSSTLKPNGVKFNESVATSVTSRYVITDNVNWYGKYPHDKAFVTLDDGIGQRLIFHGACGGRPVALSDSRILLIGCGWIQVIDPKGAMVGHRQIDCCYAGFAGVSRDGSRFALHFSDERGDPPMLLYERFVIYDSQSLRPLAMAVPAAMPQRQSWSAFSPDGRYFAAGSPDSLGLFELPANLD